MSPFNFTKHPILLLYWALLLALGGYLAYDYYTDYRKEITPVLESSIAEGITTARRFNDFQLTEIHKSADAYLLDRFQMVRNKAKAARKMVDACQELIRKGKAQEQIRSSDRLNQLAITLQELGDSMLLFSNNDSTIAAGLQTLIFQPAAALRGTETALFFKYTRKSQVDLHLEDLVWKLELSLNILMPYFYSKVYQPDFQFDSIVPLVNYQYCARAGQSFSGEVFLQGNLSTSAENLNWCIDGREQLKRGGLVELVSKYDQPGKYRKQVELRLKNPLTEEVKTYLKTLEFNITQP